MNLNFEHKKYPHLPTFSNDNTCIYNNSDIMTINTLIIFVGIYIILCLIAYRNPIHIECYSI